MKATKWNDNWKFWKDKDSFALIWNVPENAYDVTLPHDAMLLEKPCEDSPNVTNTGFRNAECYTYVKIFVPSEDWKNKLTRVAFEGVYMNAFVYLNGQFVAKSPSGYQTFTADLTNLLQFGKENELRVLVKAGAMPNSRWYSGAGIYRDVYLLQSRKCHILQNGIKVITEEAEDISTIRAEITLENITENPVNLCLDTKIFEDKCDNFCAVEQTKVFLQAGESRTVIQRIAIENAKLWSDVNPYLYKIEAQLYNDENNEVFDEASECFGIRKISLDAKRGLRVNGKTVKLRGACVHHDSGVLGVKTYYDAEFRRVKILKEAGFNALRMSHQPMAQAMLKACDELGVYVMDEFSDMWNRMKSNYDYGLYFEEWWKTDVKSMVEKDFNHPSVILYSIGNEIPEIGTDAGSKTAFQISELFHTLDSTRFTTAGINGVFASGEAIPKIMQDIMSSLPSQEKEGGNVNDFMTAMDKHLDKIVVHNEISKRLDKACAALDVAGYNYMRARYEDDGKKYPNRIIVGSETYPPDIAKNWREVKKLNHVIGDFTWTGWDYIGEAGVGIPAYKFGDGGFGARFPSQLAFCGDIDITGFRRPMSYLREIVFGLRDKPYIAVQRPEHFGENLIKTPWVLSDTIHSWTFLDCIGKKAIVEVYSAGDEVELFINGISQGKKKAGEAVDFRTLFEVTIASGSIKAVTYKNGSVLGKDEIFSSGEGAKIKGDVESYQNLLFLDISILDESNNLVPQKTFEVKVEEITGAKLLGFGSANPKPEENYTEKTTNTWEGRAFAVFEKTSEKVKVKVESQGLLPYCLEI